MSLNAIINHMQTTEPEAIAAAERNRPLNAKEREYAERIFFVKQLKECNHGMSEEKIKERIEKAIAIAKLLYRKIHEE